MQDELEKYRTISLSLCEKLIRDLSNNLHDADRALGGDIYKAYEKATERAIENAQKARRKIQIL